MAGLRQHPELADVPGTQCELIAGLCRTDSEGLVHHDEKKALVLNPTREEVFPKSSIQLRTGLPEEL